MADPDPSDNLASVAITASDPAWRHPTCIPGGIVEDVRR
jgi:hypothetical protein